MVKTIAVVAIVIVGVVALAVTGFVGFLFYKAHVPERVSAMGRVTDSGENPSRESRCTLFPYLSPAYFGL